MEDLSGGFAGVRIQVLRIFSRCWRGGWATYIPDGNQSRSEALTNQQTARHERHALQMVQAPLLIRC